MLKRFFITIMATAALALPATAGDGKSAFDFTLTSIDRSAMPLDQYKGKTLLVVNTATYCGFTPQYEGLQALWDQYRDDGLVVIGVPSNDFGGQEPGSEQDIKRFCKMNYSVDFPMTMKMKVNGEEGTADFYNWLADRMGEGSRPAWNFHKYLIAPDGTPKAYFDSKVEPQSDTLVAAVKDTLGK
ncbi:glutathione peroxidase [Yunchengibacter salinarum]|uniref:glutathione peroxidase n=1 Tax=Yunchengibacter salinarum TaxID=3133399 RepID=UPI0035B685E7